MGLGFGGLRGVLGAAARGSDVEVDFAVEGGATGLPVGLPCCVLGRETFCNEAAVPDCALPDVGCGV